MIKPELYHKTVGILFDAYFNDTLQHGNCYACAVGNMVAANCGRQFTLKNDGEWAWTEGSYPGHYGWGRVFITNCTGNQMLYAENYIGEAKIQIDSTGYEWKELAKIEKAFEKAPKGDSEEDYMFNGLVAVLEVLKDIHQVTDQDLLTSNNNRFKEQYERRITCTQR